MFIGEGIGGFLSGAVVTPVIMAVGGMGLGKGLNFMRKLTPEQEQMATGAGAVGTGCLMMSAFESTAFLTGFKVAIVGWSAIAGAFTGCQVIDAQIKHLGLDTLMPADWIVGKVYVTAIGALAGAIIATTAIAAFPALPAIGLSIGGVGAHMISRFIYQWMCESWLREKIQGFPGLFAMPQAPDRTVFMQAQARLSQLAGFSF